MPVRTRYRLKQRRSNSKPFFPLFFLSFVLLVIVLANKIIDAKVMQREVRTKIVSALPISRFITPTPTLFPTPTKEILPSPTPLPTRQVQKEFLKQTQNNVENNQDPWGVAKQLDSVTWTIKVGEDQRMATAQEIFEALNIYRSTNGRSTLTWNDNLASFAQGRADVFATLKSTDKHAGFNEYLKDQENFKKLGFMAVGENSSYGFKLLGVHLIEWVYAGDQPHNDNQLNPNWTHVGIGVNGTATDIVFGKN